MKINSLKFLLGVFMSVGSVCHGAEGLASPAHPPDYFIPEASTVVVGALLLLPLGASALRIVRRHRA